MFRQIKFRFLKIMATNNFNPAKYGATPFDPAAQGAVPAGPDPAQQTMTQKGSDFMRGIGMGAGPDLMGGMQAASTPVANALLTLVGSDKRAQPKDNEFFTPEQEAQWRDPVEATKNVGADLAGAASYTQLPQVATAGLAAKVPFLSFLSAPGIAPAAARYLTRGAIRGELLGTSQHDPFNATYPIGGSIAELVAGLISTVLRGGVTKGQVYKNMEKAASKSDQPTSLRDIFTESKATMPDRMKSTYDLNKKEADKVLRTLVETKGNPDFGSVQLSPKELLDWRSHLSPEASQNYLERFGGIIRNMDPKANIDSKTADVLRSVISAHLKDAVPQMGGLGQLYGAYNNPLIGPAWSWIPRGVAAAAGVPLLSKLVKGNQ